mgnify:FL=1
MTRLTEEKYAAFTFSRKVSTSNTIGLLVAVAFSLYKKALFCESRQKFVLNFKRAQIIDNQNEFVL